MTFQHQLSCTMVTHTADTLPSINRQHQLSCIVMSAETAHQSDFLKNHADNIWFVLGAYFFAFLPWAIMNNIDFISEKWRTCRRTRTLARIHLAGSILPIIYVAVYAEAQRRDKDYKEFGAALAALTFNVFQLLRTMMGIVQLNAFVAWCKDAVECMRALSREYDEDSENNECSSFEIGERGISSRADSSNQRTSRETRKWCGLLQLNIFRTWCERRMERMRKYICRNTQDRESSSGADEKDFESSWKSYMSGVEGCEDIEEKIEVNNTVVDNELGGREVTVLPSWKKMWEGLKKGSFTPSRWLQTDRVVLNTVRWCGAYLCGMGEQWSVQEFGSRASGEMLEKFFSWDMLDMCRILQDVEWDLDVENRGKELMSIRMLAGYGAAELIGEMSTAYGTGLDSFVFGSTDSVDLYSFEFNSLVSSYRASDKQPTSGNRETVKVGLAHSVMLAKHLGVQKLKAIRRYYDHYRVPPGSLREESLKLLHKQTAADLPDDAMVWWMCRSTDWKIPLFPYRMQTVALWDEATNWRLLQASAHQDIWNSLSCGRNIQIENDENLLFKAPQRVNIFDYCANWTNQRIPWKKKLGWRDPLGVVIETVRTFLAEWLTETSQEPVWEPEVSKDCFKFDLGETRNMFDSSYEDFFISRQRRLVWICQRELQKAVARIPNKDECFSGNGALIMLFLLGFPLLNMEEVMEAEFCREKSREEVYEASTAYSSNRHLGVDLSVQLWRAWTVLAPQDISLMFRVDWQEGTVSLRLKNRSGGERFIWQDWVDAAMGCMKGFEDGDNRHSGYGRHIVRADLRKPMVELCPLYLNEDGIEPEVEETSTARVWTGWPAFDVRICKFELEQWLLACDIDLNGALNQIELGEAEDEVERIEKVIKLILSEDNAKVESSTDSAEEQEKVS